MSEPKQESRHVHPFRVAEVLLEIPIAADPERAFTAFTAEISEWWPSDFYTHASTQAFRCEAKLGGKVYEDWGDGNGLIWFQVIGLERGKELRLAGELAADFGGPAHVHARITFEPESGGTRLRFQESLFGKLGAAAGDEQTEGWRMLLEDCYKPWVEEGAKKSGGRPAHE